MDDNSELENLLDKYPELGLERVHKTPSRRSRTGVYEVSCDDESCILKIAPKNDNHAYSQVMRELEVLEWLDGRLTSPRIKGKIETKNYVAILKDKVEGFFTEFWKGKGLYKPAKERIEEFHDSGVSGLDIAQRNLCIHSLKEKDIRPVDFGYACLKERKPKTYAAFARQDMDYLERMFM